MAVRNLMTPDPVFVTPDDSLVDAARLMVERNIGFLPVCESRDTRRAIGCLTDRDIVARAVAQGKNPADTRVRHAMSRDLVTVTPDDDLDRAKLQMREHQVRRVLVCEADGTLAGVVAFADLARAVNDLDVGETIGRISQPTETPRT